jgi:hypothetical protein
MTAFDYSKTLSVAQRLIAKFGVTGAIRRSVTTGGDSWNPGSGTTVITDYPAIMVVTNYAQADINGTVIQNTDRKVLVSTSGLTIVPTTGDVLVVDGQTLSVIGVNPLKPGGTLLLYEIQGRTA